MPNHVFHDNHPIDEIFSYDFVSSQLSQPNCDVFSVYFLLNTWGNLFPQDYKIHFRYIIRKFGVSDSIRYAAECADHFLREEIDANNPFNGYLRSCTLSTAEDRKRILFTLRYPKRFTPHKTDALDDEAIRKFADANRRCREYNRDMFGHGFHHTRNLREIIWTILPGLLPTHTRSKNKPKWRRPTIDMHSWHVPSGATAETDGNKYRRDKKLENFLSTYPDPMIPAPIKRTLMVNRVSHGHCVPKNYKASRFIAYEPTATQMINMCIAEAMEQTIHYTGFDHYIKLHDQGQNRYMAKLGSTDNSLATIDLTSASDLNSFRLVRDLVHPYWFRLLCDNRAQRLLLPNGKVMNLHTFSTMGSRITFILESILFLGISLLAYDYTRIYLGIECDPKTTLSVYGDDIICDSNVAPVLISLLDYFGHIPNTEKSFYENENFRESCGVDAYFGEDISSRYYPRSDIQDDSTGIEKLINLQHRLVSTPANNFLVEALMIRCPKLTQSYVGSPYTDLWCDYPILSRRPIEGAPDGFMVEYHTTFTESYGKGLKDAYDPETQVYSELAAYLDWLRNASDRLLPVYEYPIVEHISYQHKGNRKMITKGEIIYINE